MTPEQEKRIFDKQNKHAEHYGLGAGKIIEYRDSPYLPPIPYHYDVKGTWQGLQRSSIPIARLRRQFDSLAMNQGEQKMEDGLQINRVQNGWIVRAGCWTLVFTDALTLSSEFARWLQNPTEITREYMKKYGELVEEARMGIPMDDSIRDANTPLQGRVRKS